DRVQRVHRTLEDDRRPGPADRAQPTPAHRGHVLAVQLDRAGDLRAARQQPERGHGQRRLAAAGLTGDTHRAARRDRQRDPVDGDDPTAVLAGGPVGDPDVLPLQRRRHRPALRRRHQRALSAGLNTASSARPTRVKQSTTTTIARPGGITYHQKPAVAAPVSSAVFSIDPQDTVPGSPRPRKLSVDSEITADPTVSVVLASTSGSTAGSTCRPRMCPSPAPKALARS